MIIHQCPLVGSRILQNYARGTTEKHIIGSVNYRNTRTYEFSLSIKKFLVNIKVNNNIYNRTLFLIIQFKTMIL